MTQRSASSYLSIITKRLKRARTFDALAAYVASDAFAAAFAAIGPDNRRIAAGALAKAWARFAAPRHGPDTGERVRWTPDRIAKVRALAPRYPNNSDLARALDVPLGAAKMARSRYVTHAQMAA